MDPLEAGEGEPSPSGAGAEARDSERFYCPYPGCNRSFAELWRLKVHFRAPPDIRGSGRERGHGTELTHCPKCQKTLKPGKHHVGCSGGKTAPRQAVKRSRMGSDNASGGHDDDVQDGPTSQAPKRKAGTSAKKAEAAAEAANAAALAATAALAQNTDPLAWQAGQAAAAGMFYGQGGMGYCAPGWPDPSSGYLAGVGQAYPAQFMQPGVYAHPGMAQQLPAFPSMVSPAAAAGYQMPPHGQVMQQQQPAAFPGLGGMETQQQFMQPSSTLPTPPLPAPAPAETQAVAGGASTSALKQEPGLDGLDIEELTKGFGRIPSPPPLPADFHAGQATATFFNFAQFSQRLSRSQSLTVLDRELAAAGLELPDPNLLYDHTDDGDVMSLLFGMPDDVPSMATIHIHQYRGEDGGADTSSMAQSSMGTSQQQPASSSGRAFANQVMQPRAGFGEDVGGQSSQQLQGLQAAAQLQQPGPMNGSGGGGGRCQFDHEPQSSGEGPARRHASPPPQRALGGSACNSLCTERIVSSRWAARGVQR